MGHDEERASLLDGGGVDIYESVDDRQQDASSAAFIRHRRSPMAAMAVAADIRTSISAAGGGHVAFVDVVEEEANDDGGGSGRRTDHSRHDGGRGGGRGRKEGNGVDRRHTPPSSSTMLSASVSSKMREISNQLPAIFVVCIFVFMLGIPFGAAFFPTELDLPGKEILGLRMFLFASLISQLTFTYYSKFDNCVGVQMVENVPFYIELSRILLAEGGNGKSTISTLFFLFGLSSFIVGCVFYILGKFELGRVLYFFPKHVLVGCIGGIGLFIVKTALEVSTNTVLTFTIDGIENCLYRNSHLLFPVFAFELALRLLMRYTTTEDGTVRYPLLGPTYYCCITPAFYAVLFAFGSSPGYAEQMGYFFPPLTPDNDSSTTGGGDDDLFRIFEMIDVKSISWRAVIKCIPTILGLTAFSLIHVPINIPAFGMYLYMHLFVSLRSISIVWYYHHRYIRQSIHRFIFALQISPPPPPCSYSDLYQCRTGYER
jgi:hypothetical protein